MSLSNVLYVLTVLSCFLSAHARDGQQIDCLGQPNYFCDDFENGMSSLWVVEGPEVWQVSDGIVSAFLYGTQVHSYLLVGDSSWNDYTVEFDVIGHEGVEKTIGFRHQPNRPGYGFSIRSDWNGDEAILHRIGDGIMQLVTLPSQNGIWYHVSITCVGSRIIVSVDGERVIDFVDSDNSCPTGGIFLSCNTGDAGLCGLSFDNVIVKEVNAPPTELLVYWNFDENSGDTVFDVSGNGKHAVLSNGPVWVSGKEGSALYFDGFDDYALFPSLYPSSPPSLTVTFWARRDNHSNVGSAIYHGRNGEWGVGFGIDRFGAGVKQQCCDWISQYCPYPQDSVWHNFSMTWTPGDSIRLFVDGLACAAASVQNSLLLDPAWADFHPAIGAYTELPIVRDFFQGAIDEVKVMDRALTAEEVWSEYRQLGFQAGDANGDGTVSVGDAVFMINFIFAGGIAPNPIESGDPNCDGKTNISDAVYLINYIFGGGPAPCEM